MHPSGKNPTLMPQTPSRTLWIDYLRSFLTILVVAHHSSLAYTTFASFDKVAYILSTHPVVDSSRWIGMDIFENFNDVFFMSLMFLIAGLFVVKSIQRKGRAAFIRDRFYRLFVPFIIGGTLLNLIAHYPAYLLAHGSGSLHTYITDFFVVEQWPVGPPWFIWVLFVFNLVFAILYRHSKQQSASSPASLVGRFSKPGSVVLLWFLFTFTLYVPFALWLGPGKWIGLGPFDFQVTRAAWYFGYFLLGAWLGTVHFNETIFGITSPLVRLWRLWLIACASAYTLLTFASPYLTLLVNDGTLPEFTGYFIYFSIYVLSATFSCIAFLTTFRAIFQRQNRVWDSLSEHAYLIYLLHYPAVLWAQYILRDAPVHAFFKFTITFLVSLTISWVIAMQLRRIELFKKYL